MKHSFYLPMLFMLLCHAPAEAQSKPKDKWQPLFDGRSLTGWRQAQKDSVPDAGWSAEHGELSFDPERFHGTDIITTRTFTSFELVLDFKVAEGGNSGIKYFLLPNTTLGCEYQLIDDIRHPDAALGINGNRKTGSLYDILPANPAKPYKGAGVWNTARIIVKGDHAEHWLNGVKILQYERGSAAFKEAIGQSKFKTTTGFAAPISSSILLQAHGDKVTFRNIKIKEL